MTESVPTAAARPLTYVLDTSVLLADPSYLFGAFVDTWY